MAAGDNYRRIEPTDQLVFDADGALVGVRSGKSDSAELRGLNASEVAAIRSAGLPITFDATTDTQVATLVPGEHYSFTLPAAGTYRVDPDMDVLVKSSDASACYGADLTDDTDAYSTTAGSLAAQTGLDFGVASFTAEAWVQCNGPLPNGARLFDFGVAGAARFTVYFTNAASNNVRVGATLVGNAGTSIKDDSSASALADTYPLGSALYHLTVIALRAAGGATGRLRYYLNGVQVQESTWTEAGSPTSFDLSGVTSGSARLVIGGTVGANAEWDGRIEDIKFYNTALSVSQIEARTAAGPVRSLGLDSADASLKWWVSFQNSGSWSNALYPECISGYGNAVFNSLIGSPAITERSGGAAASSQNSARVYAGRPQAVECTGDYLAVWGDSASGGTVRVTPI